MNSENEANKIKAFSQAELSTSDETINCSNITDRITKIEGDVAALLAGHGRANDKIIEYIQDVKKDLKETRWIRRFVLLFSTSYIVIINILLAKLIFGYKTYFFFLGSYTRVAFIFAAVSSSIGLFVAVLRGTFKNSAERHKENHTLSEIKALANSVNQKDMP